MANRGISEKKIVVVVSVFLALVLCFFASAPVYAQVTGATLSGTITDASGGAVAGAQVAVRNTATGIANDTTTDSAGFYSVPNLIPGPYEVKVTAKGFTTAVQSNLALAVGAQQTLNIPMKVGETSTTVQVTEAAPQIDLTSSTLTGQIESQTVLDLPLNGRDWTSLATLHPGVNLIETQMDYATSARGNRGFGAELTISGQRTTNNNYRLDGISVNDYANSGPGNVLGAALGVDAIQEFSVLTGSYSAEYGKASGGVVNAITKSGTNGFHGDAYEFLRNSALDSRDYFSRSGNTPRAEFRRNQFGVAAGGPIIKDKTFIFGDYEGMRQFKGITTSRKVPSVAAKSGIITYTGTAPAGCAPIGATGTCQVTPDANAAKIFQMYPDPTPGTTSGDQGKFIFNANQIVPENFYTFRVDHKLSANDSLSGTYLFDKTIFDQPDSFNNDIQHSQTKRQTFVLQESHTFGAHVVNAARIGFSRTNVINLKPAGTTPGHAFAADPALGSTNGQNAPEVDIGGGFFRMPGGVGANSYYNHPYNSYQFYDDAFWTHGAHTIKFGGGVEHMRYNFTAFQNQGGLWKFDDLYHLLTNQAKHFETGIPEAIQPREARQTLLAGYIQDDWRMRSNLTVNLGLRYETVDVYHDSQGKVTNLPTIADGVATSPQCGTQYTATAFASLVGSACASVGPYYLNPTRRNFEPRVGFAWDPFRDGKTSVRGGFSIYDVLPLPGYFLLQQNQAGPFMIFASSDSRADLKGKFLSSPGSGEAVLLQGTSGQLATSTVEHAPKRNYVLQWNLNVQRQITPDLSLTVGYIGSHGVHMLMRGDDGNMTQGQQTSAGLLFPCGPSTAAPGTCTPGLTADAAGTNAKINQTFGTIRYIYWGTDSFYDALNVSLDKRMSHGLQFQFAYTWGKSIDDSSATIAGDTFGNGLNSLYYFAPKSLRGPSDYNIGQNISVNVLWALPTPKSLNGFAKAAVGGWQIGGIVKYNNGVPTTPTIDGDPAGLGNQGSDVFGIPNRIPGCDPINHNFIGGSSPIYINTACFTLPTAPSSFASQCANFTGAVPATPPSGQVYCQNLLGNAGRNSIVGPKLVNVDFSATKNNPIRRISETFNVQFRAEIFNILNRSNFVAPAPLAGGDLLNTDGSPLSGAGFLDTLATQPRDVQFALKFIW
jgi:carboxypeptidase family protein/TonB-dependent receptor-like protein